MPGEAQYGGGGQKEYRRCQSPSKSCLAKEQRALAWESGELRCAEKEAHGEDLAWPVDQQESPGGPHVEDQDGWLDSVGEHWSRQALGAPGAGVGRGTSVCLPVRQ